VPAARPVPCLVGGKRASSPALSWRVRSALRVGRTCRACRYRQKRNTCGIAAQPVDAKQQPLQASEGLHRAPPAPTPARMPTSHVTQAVLIEGPDAVAFAHSQFASQVTALANGQWQFSSWLDAQGRVRNVFHLARIGDERLMVILRGGNATDFIDALRRFVFRSRVKLIAVDGSLAGGEAMPMHHVDVHDDVVRLGCGTHAMLFGAHVGNNETWRLQQLRAGWPWLPDASLNDMLPPALSLHRLGAVAIDKGCYPGQEIVARLHYRGGNKRHLHHVVLSEAVEDGSLLHHEGRKFVQLLGVIAQDERVEALAVISDEDANNIAQHTEIISDEKITMHLLTGWPD